MVGESGNHAAPPSRDTVTILVIDDDQDLRGYIGDCLRRDAEIPSTVVEVATAREALDLLEHSVPDLVITDAVMPGMDGFALIREIRTQAPGVDPPILMVTGRLPWREASARAREAGAQALLPKPFNASQLCEAVARLLNARSSANQRPRQDGAFPG